MLKVFEPEVPAGTQCSCTMFLCSKLNLVEPQPRVPQNSENSPVPIFLKKVLLKRLELQDKHSPEKRKLVLLTLSTLKHSVRLTVQYWTLTESPSLLGDGWEGRSHFKLLCICFVCEPFTLRWWASTLLPHKSTRHMQNRKIFTQLRLQ